MQEIRIHRGFTVTIVTEADPPDDSSLETRIVRSHGDRPKSPQWTAPRLSRSRFRGRAAIGAALGEARSEIDSALSADSPLGDATRRIQVCGLIATPTSAVHRTPRAYSLP